jgi:hypothetical protein
MTVSNYCLNFNNLFFDFDKKLIEIVKQSVLAMRKEGFLKKQNNFGFTTKQ